MEPISNLDRIVALLRQRLADRARMAKSGAPPVKERNAEARPNALAALVGAETLDERQLKRALVQNILAEQFGGQTLNDARFQGVVDQVTAALEGHPQTADLFEQALEELRSSAG